MDGRGKSKEQRVRTEEFLVTALEKRFVGLLSYPE
jgi:hypothetical protein